MSDKLKEALSITGRLTITLMDEATGKVKQFLDVDNLVVTAGKEFIADCIRSEPGPDRMKEMAVGIDNTAPAVSDVELVDEVARIGLTASGTGQVITYQATFPAGVGTGALAEAGIFSADSPSTMLCRTTFPIVNKGAADSIAINWNLTIN